MPDHPLSTSGRVFVTADTHFGQANAITNYDRRFLDLDEMEAGYVDGINAVMGAEDLLLHLGDFVGDLDSRKQKIRVASRTIERLAVKRLAVETHWEKTLWESSSCGRGRQRIHRRRAASAAESGRSAGRGPRRPNARQRACARRVATRCACSASRCPGGR